MIEFLFKTAIKALFLATALYVCFFVDVGPRTVFEHVSKIAKTREAQVFGDALGDVASKYVVTPAMTFFDEQRGRLSASTDGS